MDWVVLVQGGRIIEQGTYDDLRSNGPKFKELLAQAGSIEEGSAEEGPSQGGASEKGGKKEKKDEKKKEEGEKKAKTGTKLVKAEEKESGIVSFKVRLRHPHVTSAPLSECCLTWESPSGKAAYHAVPSLWESGTPKSLESRLLTMSAASFRWKWPRNGHCP